MEGFYQIIAIMDVIKIWYSPYNKEQWKYPQSYWLRTIKMNWIASEELPSGKIFTSLKQMLCYKQYVTSLELGRGNFLTHQVHCRCAEKRVTKRVTKGLLCLMWQSSVKSFSTKRMSFSCVDEWVPCRDLSARSVKLQHSLSHPVVCHVLLKIPFLYHEDTILSFKNPF